MSGLLIRAALFEQDLGIDFCLHKEEIHTMSDRAKLWLSGALFILSLALPVVLLLIVWRFDDFPTALIWSGIFFVIFFGGAIVTLFSVKDISVFSASFPYLFSTLYAVLPDAILGPFDDTVILGVGAALSYILEIRRNPSSPKWVLIFPVLALMYLFLGNFLPGPLDEFLIGGLLYLAYLFTTSRYDSALIQSSTSSEE